MTIDETVNQYSDLVYVLAKARTKQLSDADDVYQDVFCRYIEKKPKFKDETHAQAWFIRVTINTAKNMYRRFEFLKRADVEDSDLENRISDEDFLRRVDERTDFEAMLGKLSEDHRTVLLMRFYFGYSVKETAQVLDKTEDSVKGLLARAKKQYAEYVEREKKTEKKKKVTAVKGDDQHD